MENFTMTIDATHMSRVRSVCPEVGRVLLAGSRGWVQGTTLPISGKAGVVGRVTVQGAQAFPTPSDNTYNSMDVPPFRTGRPPV